MRNWYARLVLWLIRPALELCIQSRKSETLDEAVTRIVQRDLQANGPIARSMRTGAGTSEPCFRSRRG